MANNYLAKSNTSEIPSATISRLVIYLRILEELANNDIREISSEKLATLAQGSAFQIRKDLAYFGTFGTRGAGYTVPTLLRELRRILGLTRQWNVVIIGMGRLGQALADYPRFVHYNYHLSAAVDINPELVNKEFSGLKVEDIRDLSKIIKERMVDIGFLTVPQKSAQEAADALIQAGIKGILNFSPTIITVPDNIHVETVDFLAGLKRISYYIK